MAKMKKDIILNPQPTNDPNDPLNWTTKRRLQSSVIQMVWAFFCSGFINALPPAYLLIEQETSITISDLNLGNGLMYLFFGFGSRSGGFLYCFDLALCIIVLLNCSPLVQKFVHAWPIEHGLFKEEVRSRSKDDTDDGIHAVYPAPAGGVSEKSGRDGGHKRAAEEAPVVETHMEATLVRELGIRYA